MTEFQQSLRNFNSVLERILAKKRMKKNFTCICAGLCLGLDLMLLLSTTHIATVWISALISADPTGNCRISRDPPCTKLYRTCSPFLWFTASCIWQEIGSKRCFQVGMPLLTRRGCSSVTKYLLCMLNMNAP